MSVDQCTMLCTKCKKVTPSGKYKRCKRCRVREMDNAKVRRKRKREARVPEGMRRCTRCVNNKPMDQFVSIVARRKELTSQCLPCRQVLIRSQKNPSTTTGACIEVWKKWRRDNPCPCGETRAIEAPGTPSCGTYTLWASKGVNALIAELKRRRPICRWCNKIRKKPLLLNPTFRQRYEIMKADMLRRGRCLTCKREVTPENAHAFEWDHRNPVTKKYNIAQMYKLTNFAKLYPIEAAKCDLLCCMCHYKKTWYGECSDSDE